jgi:hypothetical protein
MTQYVTITEAARRSGVSSKTMRACHPGRQTKSPLPAAKPL